MTKPTRRSSGCTVKVGLGSVAAMILSWGLNHSICWMLLHGFLGWFYVIYWAIFL